MNFPDTFYSIDVCFGVFVLLFGVAGLLRGLAGGLARLLAFLFVLIGFAFFFPALTQMAFRQWSALAPAVVQVAVGVVFLLAGLLVFWGLRFGFRHWLKERVSGWVDKIFGALVGLLTGVLLGLSVLTAVSLIPHESAYRVLSEKSVVGYWVCDRLTPWLYPRVLELPVFDGEEE